MSLARPVYGSNGTWKDLSIADGGGGHQQVGESGHSGADGAPFTKATGLAIFWIVGHDYEERRGIGRKSMAVRFRALRSWGVQISLCGSRWRRGKVSETPRSWPSKEPANEFDGNYLIIDDRKTIRRKWPDPWTSPDNSSFFSPRLTPSRVLFQFFFHVCVLLCLPVRWNCTIGQLCNLSLYVISLWLRLFRKIVSAVTRLFRFFFASNFVDIFYFSDVENLTPSKYHRRIYSSVQQYQQEHKKMCYQFNFLKLKLFSIIF